MMTQGSALKDERPPQKFKVGQIVVMTSLKKALPFRIIGVTWDDGWFYQWNSQNFAAESMIRALTPEEKGDTLLASSSALKAEQR